MPSKESSMAEEQLEFIEMHRHLLEERIDPDFGLLDKLLANTVLTKRQIDKIRAQETFQERNAKLLDYILEGNVNDSFNRNLRDSRQNHIVNYLSRNGEYERSSVGGDWPSTEREIRILDANHETLVDLIDPDEFVIALYSMDVINIRQKDFISAKPATFGKNEALLDILRRRSLNDYSKMIECLNETNQGHLSEILSDGGVIARVRAELEVPNLNHVEQEIVTSITNSLRNQSLQEATHILELVQLNLLATKTGHSILLYFYCKTLDQLDNLNLNAKSGKLKSYIERTCNELRNTKNTIRVTVFWTINDYRSYKNRFGVDIHFISKLDLLDKRSVTAVAEYNNSICVLCNHPVSVLLISVQQPFAVEDEITTDVIEMPCDMIARPQSDCIYITDMAKNCVWKVTLPGGETKEWLPCISWPYTLSLCRSGCLMMLQQFTDAFSGDGDDIDTDDSDESVSDSSCEQNYRLEFYKSDSFLDNLVQLPAFITFPFHAIENSRGNFIISYNGTAQIVEEHETPVTEMQWGICEVNKSGESLHCFIPQNPLQELRLPCYLALDADDRVFVADQARNQVFLLDSGLRWSFLSKPEDDQTIYLPRRLCFDRSRNLLLVVHMEHSRASGICSVYSVQL